ncbi:MAG: GGDEF domain-containing phosphodiesterase [Lachnospiraceae bacterium]|nr:GGDEF domain-containing phosphodiesterase [Lachnospiraceae bacterium]
MPVKGRSGKEKAVADILWVGFSLLFICIMTCITLVLGLQNSFREQVAEDFHQQHLNVGDFFDSLLLERGRYMKAVAERLTGLPDEELQEAIVSAEELQPYLDLRYVRKDGTVFGALGKEEDHERIVTQLDGLEMNEQGFFAGLAPVSVKVFLGTREMLAVPVSRGGEQDGYLFAAMDSKALFDMEGFRYQVEKGECLVVSDVGEIIAYNDDYVIVDSNAESFQLGILAYSKGEENSRRAIQELNYDFSKKASGYVTFTTSYGYRIQISYSPLRNASHEFFVSCYKDDLVDAEIRPLIFRSVLACMIIMFLMIGALTYVWATAKRTNLTVERLAYEDPVTGGHNLNYFREHAPGIMINSPEVPFVIYRFDIMNFRYINESYGHLRADKVLVSCISNFRQIFSARELCVRMDADQFLALLVNDSRQEKHIDDFTAGVNADARGYGIKYPVRFKYGIYPIKKHDHDIDVMIDHANVARRTLSSDGKEMKAVYSESIVDDMRKVDHIESSMQKALAENEFKVFLQPKLDIRDNAVKGAEALVRWMRNDGTVIQPDSFVPIFENNGFIEQLDFYTLESVCMRMREMMDEGIEVLPVSVNQSRLLLHSPDYVENVEKILKQYSIPGNMIELEITESVFDNEKEEMIGIVRRLKLLGVSLAMDDFGAGYSSLNMLTEVPFDVIKIDGKFFAHSSSNEKERLVIRKIVELVHGLGMEIICEGVESEEQVQFLQEIGCNIVQGFYFSRPVPEPDFITRYYGHGDKA